jgi:AbrB family looped-hinge helix DNA binding protein
MSEVGVSPVSEKGRVTIPKEIREMLKLKKGDRVVFLGRDNQIIIRKAKTEKLSDTLQNQKPWNTSAPVLQRNLRGEWDA